MHTVEWSSAPALQLLRCPRCGRQTVRGNRAQPPCLVCDQAWNWPCLSVRQPWAWLILNAGKDIENRTWVTTYRGPILIHAAQGMTNKEYRECRAFAHVRRVALPDAWDLSRGGIVGYAELVNCVDSSRSRWFTGPYGWVLRKVQPTVFVPMRGQLGLFRRPATAFSG